MTLVRMWQGGGGGVPHRKQTQTFTGLDTSSPASSRRPAFQSHLPEALKPQDAQEAGEAGMLFHPPSPQIPADSIGHKPQLLLRWGCLLLPAAPGLLNAAQLHLQGLGRVR